MALYVEELGARAYQTIGAYNPLGFVTETNGSRNIHLKGNLDGLALDDGALNGHVLSIGNESGLWGVDHRELTSPDSSVDVNITPTAIELTLGTGTGLPDWEDLGESLEGGDKFQVYDSSAGGLYKLDFLTLADAVNGQANYQFVQQTGGSILTQRRILEFNAPLVPSDASGDFATKVTLGGLSSLGSANQVLGVNSGATGYEHKTVTAGASIGVTHGAGAITIAVTDAELAAIAGLTSGTDLVPMFTGSGTATTFTATTFARSLMDDANASTARTTLGVAIGTDVQAYDATLQSLSALGTAADKMAYTTGVDAWAETPLTSAARSLLDDTTTAAMLSTLGAVGGSGTTGTLPKFSATSTLADSVIKESGGAITVGGSLSVVTTGAALAVSRSGTAGAATLATFANADTAAVGNGGQFSFQALNDASSQVAFAALVGQSIGSIVAGAEYGRVQLRARNNGTLRTVYEADESSDTHTWSLNNAALGNWTPTGLRAGDGTAAAAKLDVLQATLGSDVFALGSTATNDDPALKMRQGRVATTNATVTTLTGCTLTPAASTTVRVRAEVVARRTGGSAGTAEDGAAYVIEACYKQVAGVPTLIGSVTTLYSAESQAAWDCTFDVSGADIRVRVTGATNNNITWHGNLFYQPVGT